MSTHKIYPVFIERALAGTLGPGTLEFALLGPGALFDFGTTTEAEAAAEEISGGNYQRASLPALARTLDPTGDPQVSLIADDGQGENTSQVDFGIITGPDRQAHAYLVLYRVSETDEVIPAAFVGVTQGIPDFPIMVGDSVTTPTKILLPITGVLGIQL